jgi:DNA polymerase-3 subunit epsilon
MTYFLVVDLEMTGPELGWNEIIQIGAVLYNESWQELGRYLQNVYPENEEAFSVSAEKVHGLSIEDLDDAPMQYEVLPAFEDWLCQKMGLRNPSLADKERAFRNTILCGQSVIYDINFLKFAYRKEKIKWSFSNTLIDLHTLSYFVFQILQKNAQPVPKSLSLKAIAQYFGYERELDTHNALEDAHLTGLCLKQVMRFSDKLLLK